jgi:threonine dehydratase
MIPQSWLQDASEYLARHIIKTPLTYDAQEDVYLKWENQQATGSFKVRGALNKVSNLQKWEQEQGLVTASAGNHGQGVALAGKLVGAPVTVFVSEHAVPAKIEAMRNLGAEVRLVSGGYGEAEKAGLAYAKSKGATWISAYNDAQIIAGQATLGLEILKEKPELGNAAWIVPVGGGGLISGIGAALEASQAHAKLVGVQSEASPFMQALYQRGTQEGVMEFDSLADGLAGPVEEHSLTIPLVKKYVQDFILVSEDEIKQSIAYAWRQYGERIEGAAATALAAVHSGKISSRPALVIISGGNIQPEVHTKIINSELDG